MPIKSITTTHVPMSFTSTSHGYSFPACEPRRYFLRKCGCWNEMEMKRAPDLSTCSTPRHMASRSSTTDWWGFQGSPSSVHKAVCDEAEARVS